MNKYELLYIIDKDVTEEKREASIKKINDKIAEGNGVVASVDKWGMKKFAYPINFKNEGFYVLVTFEADAAVLTEIERRMKVSETFVRFMITSVIENRKTEAAKTAKKPERRERTDYGYNRDNRAPRATEDEVVKTEEVVATEAVVEAEAVEFAEAVEAVDAVDTAEVIVEKEIAEEVQA